MGLELLAPTGAVHMMMQHYISWGHVFDPPETTRKTSFASVKLLTWGKFQETDSGKLQASWPLMRQQASSISINMSSSRILDSGFVFMSKVPRQDEGESGALMERRWVAPVGSGATWGGRCQDWMPFTSSGVRKVPRGHLPSSNPSVEGWTTSLQ